MVKEEKIEDYSDSQVKELQRMASKNVKEEKYTPDIMEEENGIVPSTSGYRRPRVMQCSPPKKKKRPPGKNPTNFKDFEPEILFNRTRKGKHQPDPSPSTSHGLGLGHGLDGSYTGDPEFSSEEEEEEEEEETNDGMKSQCPYCKTSHKRDYGNGHLICCPALRELEKTLGETATCIGCKSKTGTVSEIAIHEGGCNRPDYYCHRCRETFSTLSSYRTHIAEHCPFIKEHLKKMVEEVKKEPIVVNIANGAENCKGKGKGKGKSSSIRGTDAAHGSRNENNQPKKKDGKIDCPYCTMGFVSMKDLRKHPVYCEMMKNFELCEECLYCKQKFPYSIRRLHAFVCNKNDAMSDLSSGNLKTQRLKCPQCKESKLAIDLPYLSECLAVLQSMLTTALESNMKWDTPPHIDTWVDQAGLREWLETSGKKTLSY